MDNMLYFAKSHPDVIIPTKRAEDGGFDIYARFDEPFMVISPFSTVLVPTNLLTAFDSRFVMLLKERGSTGTQSMIQHCGVIDSGFRGEIFVPIGNHSLKTIVICKEEYLNIFNDDSFIVYPYNKAICQAVMAHNPVMKTEEISVDELKAIPSLRGTGERGSSGK